jgi:hypothetical protein
LTKGEERERETIVAEGAQSREFKYAEVFESLSQGVRAEALFRDLNYQKSSEGVVPLKYSKGGKVKFLCRRKVTARGH